MQEQRFSLNEVLKRFQTETEGNGLILDADLTMRVHVSIYHPYRLDASGQPNSELGCDPDDIVVEPTFRSLGREKIELRIYRTKQTKNLLMKSLQPQYLGVPA